jgi:RNA polymerase sigma-70 factor (ECF subfamily)
LNHSPFLHDEKNLLRQIAQGDETAFATLFYAYLANLQPYIMKLTHSAEDTEEVIQETFIRLWMNRDKLDEIQTPHAWIYTVAANECFKYLKKKTSQRNRLSDLGKANSRQGMDSSTLNIIQVKEVNRLVMEAVSQLPLRRKRIYQMSRDEGMKIPEIAATLRLSPNTVKNTLVNALGFIRKYLAAQGHEW